MDGTGQQYSYTYPVDEDEVKFVNGKERIKKLMKWAWLLMFIIWFAIGSFEAAITYLIIWFIGKIIVNKVMNNQIKNRLNASKAERQAAANRL